MPPVEVHLVQGYWLAPMWCFSNCIIFERVCFPSLHPSTFGTEKREKAIQKMQENSGKNPEKIFKKKANRHSVQVLPFYIVDLLIKNHAEKNEPLTVKMIQKMLTETGKGFFKVDNIYFVINNLHLYCKTVQLSISRPRVPGTCTHATAFSIKKIITGNEY